MKTFSNLSLGLALVLISGCTFTVTTNVDKEGESVPPKEEVAPSPAETPIPDDSNAVEPESTQEPSGSSGQDDTAEDSEAVYPANSGSAGLQDVSEDGGEGEVDADNFDAAEESSEAGALDEEPAVVTE